MKGTEPEKGRKDSSGKLFANLRQKRSSKIRRQSESKGLPSNTEPDAEELAAIEAEKERLLQEMIRREIDSMTPAEGSRLYQIYELHHGVPPVIDDEGRYSLSVFMEGNELPAEEERTLLKDLDRNMDQTYDPALGHVATVRNMNAERSNTGAPDSAADANGRGEDKPPVSIDAKCHVLMPENALYAYLFVLPPFGAGRGISVDDITHAFKTAGVSFGIVEGSIESIAEKQEYLKIVRVVTGIAPVDGSDGKIIDYFHREVKIRLQEKADGTIDYRDLGWLQTTGKGDTICEIIPPVPPRDGVNVRGDPVPGKTGIIAQPPLGEGAVLSADGSKMLAAIDGVVHFRQDCFHVEPLLTIDSDVDTAVGNLDLIGSVIISGDIRGGFSVKATGNITVQGRVENAYVQSGGSILIGNGMNGSETGTLRAEGDVACRYIEHSTVFAGNSVTSDTIVNSNVSAGNTVEVTTGRATIVGGRIAARSRVQAHTVGNYGNTLTSVILGETLESLDEKQDLMQKNIALGKELAEREKSLKHLRQRMSRTPSDQKKVEDLKKAIQLLRTSMQEHSSRLDALERAKPPNTGCFLRAGTIHPPLDLTISGVRSTVRTGTNAVRFVMRSGEVIQIPY